MLFITPQDTIALLDHASITIQHAALNSGETPETLVQSALGLVQQCCDLRQLCTCTLGPSANHLTPSLDHLVDKMVTTRRSRVGLATIALDVISGVVKAASPHQTAAAAALSATCPARRRVILSYCTDAAEMRHFGRTQQIAPLLRRLTGAQGSPRTHVIVRQLSSFIASFTHHCV